LTPFTFARYDEPIFIMARILGRTDPGPVAVPEWKSGERGKAA
jgi:hypothetical protein